MTIYKTNWADRVSALDAEVDGEVRPVAWVYGSDAAVSLDLAGRLAPNEVPVEVGVALRRLPSFNETDYADATPLLAGGPLVSGSTVSQRLQNLERGRVYRLEVLFGSAGNRRGASLLVECTE